MPYPFAHPAAALPLAPLLGRAGVPSALAIGAVVPDAWYFVPGLVRADSHGAAGLAWFCVPLGLAAYLAFHLLLKQPLAALMPHALSCRLAPLATAGLPPAPWHAVLVSLLAGALTHVAWDALAHSWSFHGVHPLQHLSTLLGTAALCWWSWRWLRRAPEWPLPASLRAGPAWRAGMLCALALVAASSARASADAPGIREALRQAWSTGAAGLGAALLGLGLLWKLRR